MPIPVFSNMGTNPFGLADVGNYALPVFVDIDGDGDFDAFIGNNSGNARFFRNTGDSSSPAFSNVGSNPFGLADVGLSNAPTFVDIDGDGDFDVFVGNNAGNTQFFLNSGTASAPAFSSVGSNPFGLANVGSYARPTFVDIDGDGDFDAFIGNQAGNVRFFRNTGSSNVPVFSNVGSNPFGLADVGSYAAPTFVDIDGDGDFDAFVGNFPGNTRFFQNNGDANSPAFSNIGNNPFGLADVGSSAAPTFVDIDGDGDNDAFIGNRAGNTIFFLDTNVPTADLIVTKTDGVTSATPGTPVTYTIVAGNPGPSDDPSVSVVDTFPAGLTCSYTSAAMGGAAGNTAAGAGNLAETLSLPAGSSVTYTADCAIDAGATGTLSNTATISGSLTDPDAGNNSETDADTVLAPEADLSITKTDGVTSAIPGTSVTYTIVAGNPGPSDDPSVSVADTFPAGLTCSYTSAAMGGAAGNTAAGAGDLAETLSMPAGSSVTYTADCAIDASATGTLSNTATISGSVTDPDAGNDSATDADTVLAAEADLSITKTDGVTSATPGTSVTYTVVAGNPGPSDDPSVSVADTFPAGLTCSYTSAAAGGAAGNTAAGAGDLAETLSLPAGSSVTYTADCAIDASATGTLSNTATISGSVTDPDAGNNSATDADTVLAPEADLSITKTDGVTSATPGTSVTYTIVASNPGHGDDPSVGVSDTFPPGLTCSYTSAAAGGATGNTAAGAGDLAETLSMPAGSSVTYTADCAIDASATGTLSNTATISGSVTDPDAGNNLATDLDTALAPQADLSVTLSSSATQVTLFDPFTYTVTATNSGPSDATGVFVAGALPPGITLISTTGCAEDPSGIPTCSLGTLAPAATAVHTIDVRATDVVQSTFRATISSNATDPLVGNNSASVSVGIAALPIPSMTLPGLSVLTLVLILAAWKQLRTGR